MALSHQVPLWSQWTPLGRIPESIRSSTLGEDDAVRVLDAAFAGSHVRSVDVTGSSSRGFQSAANAVKDGGSNEETVDDSDEDDAVLPPPAKPRTGKGHAGRRGKAKRQVLSSESEGKPSETGTGTRKGTVTHRRSVPHAGDDPSNEPIRKSMRVRQPTKKALAARK